MLLPRPTSAARLWTALLPIAQPSWDDLAATLAVQVHCYPLTVAQCSLRFEMLHSR